MVNNMVMLDKTEIRALRLRLGLSADKFGALFEPRVTGNTVFRWEQGVRFPSRRHQIRLNQIVEEQKQLQSA